MTDTLIKTATGNDTKAGTATGGDARTMTTGASTSAPVTASQKSTQSLKSVVRKRAIRQIIVGMSLIAVGIVITAVTYHAASDSSSGGTYLVMWGPIAVGALTVFRGMRALVSSTKIR